MVAAAIPVELSGVERLGRFSKSGGPDIKYIMGDVHGLDVALVVSGIGENMAYGAATRMLAALSPRAYISVGLSAALSAGLKPGDVVVGTSTTSISSGISYESDKHLIERARGSLAGCGMCGFGPLVASPHVVVGASDKAAVAARWGGMALDMESAGAARAAQEAGVPFIAVRAISDRFEEDLPVDFNLFTRDGGMDWPGLILHILTHPRKIPPLMRLGRQSGLAARNLAGAVEKLLAGLA